MRQWLFVCFSVLFLSSCGSDKINDPGHLSSCAAKPVGGLVATYDTQTSDNRRFWTAINNQLGMDDAINSWQGLTNANIPSGLLVCQPVAWNCGWNWYLDPQTVRISEITIEACQGAPFLSQSDCEAFKQHAPNGQFCAMGKMVELRDCRTDPTCPMMPR